MASSVENRVVQMTFDNAKFEQNAAKTQTTLDSLNKKLKFEGVGAGIDKVGASIANFKVGDMAGSIDRISSKFLAMSAVAITALSRITNAAITTGTQLVKSLTLDPVQAGFSEYETNMRSIQTVIANTGEPVERVNHALDVMNEYSDKTIYNFSEMAKNIGTFTAAGVDLDTSAQSIKGIANMAAISGSTSEQASTAMYQLSQALASGTVKLMDWNSVVNAGMGGEVFQRALFESGKAFSKIKGADLGTTFEEWKDKGNTFRGSLEDGWLTTEVLTKTLQGLTGELDMAQLKALGFSDGAAYGFAMLGATGVDAATKVRTFTQLMQTVKESVGSGWSLTFRTLVGDFNEATDLFTNINTAIGGFIQKTSDARNRLLTQWKIVGGRDILITGITDGLKAIGDVIKPVIAGFRMIFPPMTVGRLLALTQGFAAFTKALRPSSQLMAVLKIAFAGFFSVVKIGVEILKGVFKSIKTILSSFSGAGSGFLAWIAKLGQFFIDLKTFLVDGERIAQFFEKLTYYILNPVEALEKLSNFFKNLFTGFNIEKPLESLKLVGKNLKAFFQSIGSGGLKKLSFDFLDKPIEMLQKFGDKVEEIFNKVREKFDLVDSAATAFSGRFSSVMGGLTGGGGDVGTAGVDSANETESAWTRVLDVIRSVGAELSDAWQVVKDFFVNIGQNLADAMGDGDFSGVLDIINVGLLGGIVALLAKFLKDGISIDLTGGVLDALKGSLEGLTGVFEGMQMRLKADALKSIAIAIAILAGSLLLLSMIEPAKLATAMTAVVASLSSLLGAVAILGKVFTNPKQLAGLGTLAFTITLLAGAIFIMSLALKVMATMNLAEIGKGLIGLGAGLAALVLAVNTITADTAGLVTASFAMILIGVALLVVAKSVQMFANIPWPDLIKGFIGLGVGMKILVDVLEKMPKDLASKGLGLLLMGKGLQFIAQAVLTFANMGVLDLVVGMTAMNVALTMIAGAMKAMPTNMPMLAAGLLVVAAAMAVLAFAIGQIGGMGVGQLVAGIIGMAAALVVLSVATQAMQGALPGAAALIIASGAMVVLAHALTILGALSIAQIITGLLALVALFGLIAGASLLLAPAVPAILAFGAALAVLGIGMALFGAGAYLTARAFEIMAEAGKNGVEAFLGALEALITKLPAIAGALAGFAITFLRGFLEGVPELIGLFGSILEKLLQLVIKMVPRIVEAVTVLITALLQAIIKLAPKVAEAGLTLVTAFISALMKKIPEIARKGLDMILGLLQGIRDNIGEVVTVVGEIITEFLTALTTQIPIIAMAVADFIIAAFTGAAEAVGKVAGTLMFGVAIAFINGFMSGLSSNWSTVSSWFSGIPGRALSAIGGVLTTLKEKGKQIISGLSSGLVERWTSVRSWLAGTPGRITGAIGRLGSLLTSIGRSIMEGLKNGMVEIWNNIADWLGSRAEAIRNLKGPPKKDAVLLIENGSLIMQGLQKGMEDEWDVVARWLSAIDPADEMTTVFNGAISRMSEAIQNMDDFNPTITPVLDLSLVESGARSMNSLFGSPTAYSNAQLIAAGFGGNNAEVPAASAPSTVEFNQTINAPKQLSTADIYRQTRNQITMAKKELSIP